MTKSIKLIFSSSKEFILFSQVINIVHGYYFKKIFEKGINLIELDFFDYITKDKLHNPVFSKNCTSFLCLFDAETVYDMMSFDINICPCCKSKWEPSLFFCDEEIKKIISSGIYNIILYSNRTWISFDKSCTGIVDIKQTILESIDLDKYDNTLTELRQQERYKDKGIIKI